MHMWVITMELSDIQIVRIYSVWWPVWPRFRLLEYNIRPVTLLSVSPPTTIGSFRHYLLGRGGRGPKDLPAVSILLITDWHICYAYVFLQLLSSKLPFYIILGLYGNMVAMATVFISLALHNIQILYQLKHILNRLFF